MTSVANPQSEPPYNDELVAYLDGELPPEECRAIEERLANDAGYRQQLHDLDQAWEALNALPPATVDDSFSRTTIELACVAAEEDLSQRKSLVEVENRSRTWWWIAGGVAAMMVGYLMVRALAVHRNNMLLAELPVIQQANVLSHVQNVNFLRQLAKAVPPNEFGKESAAFEKDLSDFQKANSSSLDERRNWVESLSPEEKATLAERTRALDELHITLAERGRMRELVNDVQGKPELERTLIAYSEWLGRLSGAKQEDLRQAIANHSTKEQIAMVQKMVHQEYEQEAHHLSDADATTLRNEILALAKAEKEKRQELPAGRNGDWIAKLDDPSRPRPAMLILLHAANPNNKKGKETIDELISKLSPEAREHWSKLSERHERFVQLVQWARDALQPKWGPEQLEDFFSDKLTPEEQQRLLDLPRTEMKDELEKLYWGSEEGIDIRMMPFWREFRDRGRRNGPGTFERRGPDDRRPRFGPDGPHDQPFGPPGGPGFLDRPRGPAEGPREPGPDDGPENEGFNRRPRRPPPGGPGPDRQPPPPPPENSQAV